MMERYPDIEIYLASVSLEALNEWLKSTLIAPPLSPAGKGKWQTRGQYEGDCVPVLLVEQAAEALQTEVRCSLGGWNPGDDPDRFWQVLPGGKEGAIEWPDSGR